MTSILSKALLDNTVLDNVIFSRQNGNLDILILVHVSVAGVVGLERAFLYVENGEVHIKILKLTLKKTPECTLITSFCVLQINDVVVVVVVDDDDDDDGVDVAR